ncbi:MAG TPA: EamA family transporter [Acidobacteriaceae bacterium]|nr:EamA family transporter [Acidobacteriaceae bacterium]
MAIKRLAAFAAVYVLWGGSYLAIHYVVTVVPPFFAAGVRYSLGALVLFGVAVVCRGQPLPGWRHILNAASTGIALLVVSYGVVYWAETRVPSWIVSILVSTILIWTYLGECFVLRLYKWRARVLLPLIAGLCGMPLLLQGTLTEDRSESLLVGLAVLAGSCLWAAITLSLKKIELPRSYIQTAAIQLGAAGGTLLSISLICGEFSQLPPAGEIFAPGPVLGMAYLVLASTVIAFSAFHWLLARESAALVATSSYVNPVVAMVLGIVVAHEPSSNAQLAGAAVVLGSVVLAWYLQWPAFSSQSSPDKAGIADKDTRDRLAAIPAQ